MAEQYEDIEFERLNAVRRCIKRGLFDPTINYLPAGFMKWLLRHFESELAAANWSDPGGWRSMVISYQNDPPQHADRIMVRLGTIPMALRNRRKLGARIIREQIDAAYDKAQRTIHVMCLGSGPGIVEMDALGEANHPADATMVDLSSDAFDFGRQWARDAGLAEQVRFIESDVRHVKDMLDYPPDIVTMIGICEYLDDQHIRDIVSALRNVMPEGSAIVFNSISPAHGTDRFFRRVFGLEMIHRSPKQLQQLLEPAGFGEFHSIPEPLGVYHMITGKRISG